MVIGSTKEVGAMQTHLLRVVTCHVLWGVQKFHTLPHLELQGSSMLVVSCHYFK